MLRELQGHRARVFAAAFSHHGDFLFTGDFTGRGILWNLESGEIEREMDWHRAKIIAAEFLEDDRTLVTASIERAVARWDFRQGTVDNSKLLLHPASLVSMDVDSRGRYVVTSCSDNVVRLWDCQTGQVIHELAAQDVDQEGAVSRVAISPDQSYFLAVNAKRRTVRVFDRSSGEELKYPTIRADAGPFLQLLESTQLSAATFSPDSQRVVTVGGDQVRLWATDQQRKQYRRLQMDFSPHGVVATATYSSDGKEILSGSWDGTAIIWDAASGKPRLKLAGQHLGRVNNAVFSPDAESRFVLTAGDDGTAVLWDAKSGDFVRRFAGHTDRLRCAAFSSDGKRVLTAGDDGTVRIWDIHDGTKPLQMLDGHDGPVLSAAFSRDQTRVVTGCADNLARIWTLATNEEPAVLKGHTASVNSVAFSRDGRRVLTGSDDFTAKLWDANTEQELLTLTGHAEEVTSVSFSPNELYVLTSSHDGTAIVWMAVPWNQDASQVAIWLPPR
jgi:WD40 repeat protein